MNKLIVPVMVLFVLFGCATLRSGYCERPPVDPNNSCTEATLKAYRHLTSDKYEYRLVMGFRYDIYNEDVGYGAHAWLEYRKPGGMWKTYDVYFTKYEGMKNTYVPLIRGKEAEKYFLAEEMYHNKGYDADLQVVKHVDEINNIVHYTFRVVYREKGEKEWKLHIF